MKKLIVLIITTVSMLSADQAIQITAAQHEKMKLHCSVAAQDLDPLHTVVACLADDLSCPDQTKAGFAITTEFNQSKVSRSAFRSMYEQGFSLELSLNYDKKSRVYDWRLYDTHRAKMLTGKRVHQENKSDRAIAHHIANLVWEALTGQEASFGSKLAYCRQSGKNPNVRSLVVRSAHANSCEQEQVVVANSSLFAPRWSTDQKNPMILYSEPTDLNVRLVSSDLNGVKRVVSNFEGLNMLPSFSGDGTKLVYCLSRDGSSQLYQCEIDQATGQKMLKRLTNNGANNVSPTLLSNGDIIFCSDFQSKGPQICYYHAGEKVVDRITDSGYCTTPSYNEKKDLIAYSKLVDGTMQIFVYDCKKKTHTQLTFDRGDKEECTWSPCGNYVAYSIETADSSRIAMMNMVTSEQFFVTGNQQKSVYPSWSSYVA